MTTTITTTTARSAALSVSRSTPRAIVAAGVLAACGMPAAAQPCPPVVQVQKLLASDGEAGDRFGLAVAMEGDVAVVGAYWEDTQGPDAGAAYVYRFNGQQWIQEQKLLASNGMAGDEFGARVAISGNTILVGAPSDDHDPNPNIQAAGSVYVFVYNGSAWQQQAKILNLNPAGSFDIFGVSVAIEGDVAVIGASFDDAPQPDSGSAWVYERVGTAWFFNQQLVVSDPAAGDRTGEGVAISGDTILVGSLSNNAKGNDSGAAYVFRKIGNAWLQEAKLTASDGSAGDWFGLGIDIDGHRALIGAHKDDATSTDTGSAYVFERTGTNWVQTAKIVPGDVQALDWFGYGLALEGDTAVIGSYQNNGLAFDGGAAYLYRLVNGVWTQINKFYGVPTQAGDFFGSSVAISVGRVLAGAYAADPAGIDSGSASVFDLEPTNIVITQQPLDQIVEPGSNAVFAVQATGTPVLVYQWRYQGLPIVIGSPFFSGQGTATLTITPVLLGMDGTIDVVVTNPCGVELTSQPASLTVIPPCYADCDENGTLSIDDFICFQTFFAIGC
jgi:FG-GAP repeat